MTKKDFELIADVVLNLPITTVERRVVASAFAYKLAGSNPRFNRERFLEACGYND